MPHNNRTEISEGYAELTGTTTELGSPVDGGVAVVERPVALDHADAVGSIHAWALLVRTRAVIAHARGIYMKGNILMLSKHHKMEKIQA